VFGVKEFHYGRPFTLVTDRKPLLTLFNESRAVPPQASGRIQRWSLTLAAYEYTLLWRLTQQHENADAMSRLPLPEKPLETPLPAELVLLMEHLEESPVTATQIRMWTRRDPLLSQVSRYLHDGWPYQCDDQLKPYWCRKMELLSMMTVYFGEAASSATSRPRVVLGELHPGHPGISRMKTLARMFVWWPGMDEDIVKTVQSCHICKQYRPAPPPTALQPWKWPSNPWSLLHLDYACWTIPWPHISSGCWCPFEMVRSIQNG